MENQALSNRLQQEADALIQTVEQVSEAQFFQQPNPEKWSIGQNVAHLIESCKPLVGLFGKPELMEQWAKSTRPSQSYDGVKTMYLNGLKTPPPRLLVYRHINTEGSQTEILNNYKALTAKFVARTNQLSDEVLDTYQIPHPLLGLITAREFVHFTAFHTLHHHEIIQKIIANIS
jgi:DinB superfamily